MRRPVMLSIAALAFAGSALAQPVSDHPSGVAVGYAAGGSYAGAPQAHSQAVADILRQARAQMRLACAADQQALCSGKAFAGRVGECLGYYRLKLSAGCRAAQDQLVVTARDAESSTLPPPAPPGRRQGG